jgi:hypothetical protein
MFWIVSNLVSEIRCHPASTIDHSYNYNKASHRSISSFRHEKNSILSASAVAFQLLLALVATVMTLNIALIYNNSIIPLLLP